MERVNVRYGIFGGPLRGKRLLAALKKADYQIVNKPEEADIIIAHSAGCFWLPEPSDKQRYLFVNPPYWPGRSIAERSRSRFRSNLHYKRAGYRLGEWALHQLQGVYYGVTDFSRTVRIAREAPRFDLIKALENRQVLLARNEADDWLTPTLSDLQETTGVRTVALPGDHENIHFHPEQYIKLIRQIPDHSM